VRLKTPAALKVIVTPGISALENIALENIAKREGIRFVRVSNSLLKHGDANGALIESVSEAPDSAWEAVLVLRVPEEDV